MPDDPLNPTPLDAAEYLDTTAPLGASVLYTVRVAVGEGPPWRESADSAALALIVEDRFAPAAPQGLVAVQEGSAARLFWNPNAERDLAGYRVYRREGETVWRRIGPEVVERPLYLDDTVAVGQSSAYRVTAIDRVDPPNESPPSREVLLELGAEPETAHPERP